MSGRLALITGASEGIGLAIAQRLATSGHRLALVARRRELLEAIREDLASRGTEVLVLAYDLADPDALAQLETRVAGLGVDVLVNNAGAGGPYQTLVELTIPQWQQLVSLNLDAALRLSRAVLPNMAANGWGRILDIASVYGLASGHGSVAYTALKHGLVGLTRALAVEWGPRGVTANAICPGFIATRMLDNLRDADPTAYERLASGIPARRLGRPEEVAGLAAFLLSDEAAYMNGSIVAIDGGLLCRIATSE